MQAVNWAEIMNDPEVDAVVIGTWPYLHHTLVLAALAANKHVLTEARLVSCMMCKQTSMHDQSTQLVGKC